MERRKKPSPPTELISEIAAAKLRLASAENQLQTAKEHARVAKRRRKEARRAARRARKQVQFAKAKRAEAEQALKIAEQKRVRTRKPAHTIRTSPGAGRKAVAPTHKPKPKQNSPRPRAGRKVSSVTAGEMILQATASKPTFEAGVSISGIATPPEQGTDQELPTEASNQIFTPHL